MKILNHENGIEQIYVQKKKIYRKIINETSQDLPNFLKNIEVENKKNEFIKFSKKEEIDFFKSFEWIVDYKTIKNLKSSQLKLMFEKYANRIDELITQIKLCTEYNLKKIILQKEYNLLLYKIKDIHSIFGNSIKENILSLPLVVDSDKVKYIINYCKQKYKMELCLDPNTIILSKEDNSIFDEHDLSKDVFSLCQAIITLKEKTLDNFYFITYTSNLSPDKKRVIMNFNPINYYDYQDDKIKEKIKNNNIF